MAEVHNPRLKANQRDRSVEVGVDVDLSSLGKRLAAILAEQESELRDVLEEYGDYLQPGKYLQTKALDALRQSFISDLTQDEKLKTALEDVAGHTLGLSSDAGKFTELLEAKIAEVLDGADGVITGEIEEVKTKVGTQLANKLGFAPDLLERVVEKVNDLIEGIRRISRNASRR